MAKFLYPCPVLGNEDDYSEEASFTFEKELILNIEEDGVQLTIPKPKINDNEINNYLKNRDLSLFLEIDSPSSFFHKVLEIKFEGDEEFFNILFPYGELNKKVFYTFFIASNKGLIIKPQLISELIKDEFTFRANEKDILALTERDYFYVDHDFDPYSGYESSFIAVAENDDIKSKDTEVDFYQNKITVKIPKAEYEKYQMFDKSYDKIFHSSIVLGVLTQAISYIRDEDLKKDFMEYKWFNLINLTIEANNIEKTLDNFSIANKILDNPIHRGFDFLQKSVEEE